jgi:ATP phosphoribosyltransferase
MLRIAVQAKGRLFEETMALLEESDIKLSTTKRTLLVQSSNFPIEVLFLRDDDIPQSVATGVADLGIVGENEFVEKQEDAEIIKRLGFSKCRLSLAMPKDIEYPGLSWFNGKKIATSYPGILDNFMKSNGVKAEVHVITGSVEVAPGIGLADAIFDIVSSGSTLVSNRLKEVEVVMKSEALLIGNKNMSIFLMAFTLSLVSFSCTGPIIGFLLVQVSTTGSVVAPASIKQDAWFSMGTFDAGKSFEYKLHQEGNGVYIFIIEGDVKVADNLLSKRDGIGLWDTKNFKVEVIQEATLLLMEVPMR